MKDDTPAFPSTDPHGYFSLGLTMRDYFAAKAMQGMLATKLGWREQKSNIARFAYDYADLMMEARK